jgi:hypothetical protein
MLPCSDRRVERIAGFDKATRPQGHTCARVIPLHYTPSGLNR